MGLQVAEALQGGAALLPGQVRDAEGGLQGVRRLPLGQEVPRGRGHGLREGRVWAGGRGGVGEVAKLEDVPDRGAKVEEDDAGRVQVQVWLFAMTPLSHGKNCHLSNRLLTVPVSLQPL